RRQPPLDLFEIRVARSVTETMAVGMDDNVDEIRIVEGRGRALVGRIIEFPIRRPELPQELAELAAIGGQSRPAPFGVKVVLAPDRMSLRRRPRRHRLGDIRDAVAIARNKAAPPLRP